MKTRYHLLATLIAASLVTACSDDDNNSASPTPLPENNAPVVTDMTAATTSATAVMIDVMSGASDADGDAMTLASAEAAEGTTTITDGQIQYDPAGYVGEDVITFAISDGTDTTSGTVTVTVTAEQVVLSYVGSETCLQCHSDDEFKAHQQHGHNFKISKIENDQAPAFPFDAKDGFDAQEALDAVIANQGAAEGATVTRNTLGMPADYSEVTYTTGGYWKKIRWFDANGHIATGANVQYNKFGSAEEGNQFSSYKNEEKYDDLVYKCGNCHTTGWREYDEVLNPKPEDALPGMGGSFVATGTQCEACHGAGSEHAKTMSKDDITLVATPRSSELLQGDTQGFGAAMHCSECHTRDGDRNHGNGYVNKFHTAFPDSDLPQSAGRIDAKGGLTRHHQTADELFGIDPATGEAMNPHYKAGLDCVSCHNPHKSSVNQAEKGDAVKTCDACHTSQGFSDASAKLAMHANFDCTSCHMPETVKNAISVTTPGGETFGDEMTHVFAIDLYNAKGQLTEDGKYMNPFLKDGWACGQCHAEGSKMDRLTELGGTIHKAAE